MAPHDSTIPPKQTRQIPPPPCPRPAQILGIDFPRPAFLTINGSFDASGIAVLIAELPAVGDVPAGDEFVIVGIEGADEGEAGVVVEEGVDEERGLEDGGAVGGGAA